MIKTINFSEALKIYKYQLTLTLIFLGGLYYSIIPLMVSEWYTDPNYSHGFLVPIISGYFIFLKFTSLKELTVAPDNLGFFIIMSGILFLFLGFAGTEYFTMRFSLIMILAGIIMVFFGKEILKKLSFPLLYLIFMIPLPYIIYNSIAFPLKLLVAKYSVVFLQAIGVVVRREGNMIIFPNIELEVVDACSGIRSLISLLALSTAFAYFIKCSPLKKTILVLSAIPIALFVNFLRVVITGILTQYWGVKAAEGFFHEFTGLVVFGLAILFLIGIGVLIKKNDI